MAWATAFEAIMDPINYDNAAPSFLTLPAELRVEIYRYLLVSPTSVSALTSIPPLETTESFPTHQDVDKGHQIGTLPSHIHPAILRTCCLINKEATSILYSENIFTIHNYDDPDCWGFSIANHFRPMVTKVRMRINEETTDLLSARAVEWMLGTGPCSRLDPMSELDEFTFVWIWERTGSDPTLSSGQEAIDEVLEIPERKIFFKHLGAVKTKRFIFEIAGWTKTYPIFERLTTILRESVSESQGGPWKTFEVRECQGPHHSHAL